MAALALVATLTGAACGNGGGSGDSTGPTTVTKRFDVLADAYVRSNESDAHFGRTRQLVVDAIPNARSYLHFEAFGLSGRIVRATLRVYSLTTSNDGFQVRATRSGWREPTVTFAVAPRPGRLIALSGPLDANAWRSIDLTSYVRAHPTTIDLALVGTSETQLALASRETGRAPELVVKTQRADT